MSPLIKICGMRETENILAAAQLMPDFLGFIFYHKSPRYAGAGLDPVILSSLPADIRKTGVFVNTDFNVIQETVAKYSLDVVQLHGNESPDLCARIKNSGLQVIKAFNISDSIDPMLFADFSETTDYFLFDAKSLKFGGSGQKFDWSLLDTNDPEHPFFLSGGIGPEDIDNIAGISNQSFNGIDLNSRFEIKPGLKDIEKLKIFINELKVIKS
jgi:phosphoribosylanthranilate isomerase